ncbi:hypothetical protein ACFLSY_10900 [Bacteroidota bacterium]
MKLLRFLSIILFISIFVLIACQKDENDEYVYMGTAFVGQSIPLGTTFSYSDGIYYHEVSFINQNSYNWRQVEGQLDFSTIVPCEYNSTTGEFSDSMVYSRNDQSFGRIQYFPVSFCIDNMEKMYLFTHDALKDTTLIFPRTIAEKITGSEGTMEGSYTSGFNLYSWYTYSGNLADNQLEAELNYTYGAGTFSGTYTARSIGQSSIDLPEYGFETSSFDTTYHTTFSGTWEYNESDNTISETMTSPIVRNFTYTPYWVSYNDKLYLATSSTRFYQKE